MPAYAGKADIISESFIGRYRMTELILSRI